MRLSVDAQVEGEGAVVAPGRLLVDLARLLPESEVVLDHRPEQGVLEITCGPAAYKLNTYSAEDFPKLPEVEGAQTFTVDSGVFLDTVAKVARSASRDESRPVLTGVLVRFEGSKLVMAATDSYRMSVKETELESAAAEELEAIVPARALTELSRVAQDAAELKIGVQENHVVFGAGDVWLTTRRIDGQFPNYKQLLPETFEHEVALPREEFLEVVRRAAVMAQRNSPLRLRFAEGEVTVSAQTQDVGEAKESLPVPFTGEALEIGFNPDFLRDGLESVETDEIALRLISPLRPGLLRSDGEDFSYLIMPIRLAG
jgi:DNA polymerase-3 subunit beta